MNATDCFKLDEVARATVDGVDYVVYSDGVCTDIVHAVEYDDVAAIYHSDRYDVVTAAWGDDDVVAWAVEDNASGDRLRDRFATKEEAEVDARWRNEAHESERYTDWCQQQAPGVTDRALFARVLAACGLRSAISGACGLVEVEASED